VNARRLQRGHSRPRARGFILLTVVLALTLVAALAFLLNRSGGMNMSLAARGLQADAARYAAEAWRRSTRRRRAATAAATPTWRRRRSARPASAPR